MKPLRVVVVTIEPPLPFRHATARWSYVLLKGLAERGHRVTAFTSLSEPETIEELKSLCLAPNIELRCYASGTRSWVRSKWQTIREPHSHLFDAAMRRDLEAELNRGFDVLHLEGTWAGWLGRGPQACKSVLNFHNLYAIDVPHESVRGLSERLRNRLRREAERRLLRSYPRLITVTPRLKAAARAIAPRASIHVVPLSLDLALYPFVHARRRPTQPVISMIGSMDWRPSHTAAIRLLTRLWPSIKERVPRATLRIVGRNARSALSAHSGGPDLEIAENVCSTRPYFESSSVLLYAPERGSGMKVKVLEAFAYGVPVVTTSDGVEGLPARDGVHAGLSDDDGGLIERAVHLLNDRDRQEQQRVAARQLLERHCDANAALDAVERCYCEIVAGGGVA